MSMTMAYYDTQCSVYVYSYGTLMTVCNYKENNRPLKTSAFTLSTEKKHHLCNSA